MPTPTNQLEQAYRIIDDVTTEVSRAVRLKKEDLDMAVGTVLVGSSVMLEGAPGSAKTLLSNSIAGAMELSFGRVQGGPDVMPKEITGAHEYNPVTGDKKFMPGPIFKNVTLVDEFNRLQTRSQSAVLEAMQENQATVGGVTYTIAQPNIVIGTQNGNAYSEGVNAVAEAAGDRFLASVEFEEYSEDDLVETELFMEREYKVQAVSSAEDLLTVRNALKKIEVSPELRKLAASIIGNIRINSAIDPEQTVLKHQRGYSSILKLARLAALGGGEMPRSKVSKNDIMLAAKYALPHRIGLSWEAAEKTTKQEVIGEAIHKA